MRNTAQNMFEILQRISLLMNSTLDSQRLLEIILDSCIEFTDATTGTIKLVNKKEQVMDIKVARGLGKDVQEKIKLKVGEGLTGWAVKHKKSAVVGDVSKDPRYVRVKEHLQSVLVVPLIVEREAIGVISVDSERKNALTQEQLAGGLDKVATMPNLWHEIISPIERLLLETALETTKQNKSRAAKLLGIHRNTLRARLS